MPKFKSIQDRVDSNTQKSCSITGCERPRVSMNKYCANHARANRKHGGPAGKSLTHGGHPKYKAELSHTQSLLRKNYDTMPVQAAIKVMSQYLNGSRRGLNLPGSQLLKMIEGVDIELHILEELCAVYIHATHHKRLSDREVTFALANALYKHVPRTYHMKTSVNGVTYKVAEVRIGPRVREDMGQYIRDNLGIFLANVYQHYKTQTTKLRSLKEEMSLPL